METPEAKEGTSDDTGERVQTCSIGVSGTLVIGSRISRQVLHASRIKLVITNPHPNEAKCSTSRTKY